MIGPPGCGKGTQSKLLAEKFNLNHISTGEILRKSGRVPKDGTLNTDAEVLEIVMDEVESDYIDYDGCILDGYPRTVQQALSLAELMEPDHVIVFKGDLEEFERRINERGKSSGRQDDQEDIIKRRMFEYLVKTEPLVGFYESKNLVINVDAMQDIGDVTDQIIKLIAT